jgi:hypothetical protein
MFIKKLNNMKTKIKREELKEIYDIACSSWKTKIEKFGNRTPFSNLIEFSSEEIQKMVNASDDKQLIVVKKIFNIVEKSETIKTLQDACEALGSNDIEVKDLRELQSRGLSRKLVALQELVVITKALNDGWEGDWDNHSQYKYILWWYLGKDFRLSDCYDYCSISDVPTRLCYKTKQIALYSAKQFINIWRDAFNS